MDVNYKDQSGMSIPLTDIVDFGDNYIRFSNGTQITWSTSTVNAIWSRDTNFNTPTFIAGPIIVYYANNGGEGSDSSVPFKGEPDVIIPYLRAIDYDITSVVGTSVSISGIMDNMINVMITSTNENIIHNKLGMQSSFLIYLLTIGKWK